MGGEELGLRGRALVGEAGFLVEEGGGEVGVGGEGCGEVGVGGGEGGVDGEGGVSEGGEKGGGGEDCGEVLDPTTD